jgi:hypothetical protein
MAVPANVIKLVDRFHNDLDYYRAPTYNETQARQEFIDPLFEMITDAWEFVGRVYTPPCAIMWSMRCSYIRGCDYVDNI